VAGNNYVVLVDQDRRIEAERFDAVIALICAQPCLRDWGARDQSPDCGLSVRTSDDPLILKSVRSARALRGVLPDQLIAARACP
jgi:hypothetical protein